MTARPVPTLDELAADPTRAGDLPRQAAEALLARLTVAQSALVGRLLALGATGSGPPPTPPEMDYWLTVEEAADLTGLPPRWFYRHWKTLPFARKPSRKALRFSEAGLRRWLAAKQAGQP